jgi:YegS/Rv2252/BmrU family lipid kinase
VSRPIALLANPSAADGRSLKCVDIVRAELEARGVAYRLATPSGKEAARAEARSAAERGEIVAAVGGDGTIGLIAGALRGTDAPLVVIPAGRGNDFARVLQIPTDPREAARVALDGEERTVDVGDVDGVPFICIASLGFDSDANRIANEAPSRLGNLVYAYGALRALAAWSPARFDLELDGGERRSYTGFSVGACNNKAYGGGMYAAPGAELDDGLLDVVLCEAMPKLRFLTRVLPRVFKGTHVELPEVHVIRTRKVRVDADRPFVVYADGDPIATTPATLEVLPAALSVLCPS